MPKVIVFHSVANVWCLTWRNSCHETLTSIIAIIISCVSVFCKHQAKYDELGLRISSNILSAQNVICMVDILHTGPRIAIKCFEPEMGLMNEATHSTRSRLQLQIVAIKCEMVVWQESTEGRNSTSTASWEKNTKTLFCYHVLFFSSKSLLHYCSQLKPVSCHSLVASNSEMPFLLSDCWWLSWLVNQQMGK